MILGAVQMDTGQREGRSKKRIEASRKPPKAAR
jgi:hypothetical protein